MQQEQESHYYMKTYKQKEKCYNHDISKNNFTHENCLLINYAWYDSNKL